MAHLTFPFLFFILLFLPRDGYSQAWWGDNGDELGTLCKSDHDSVGQHLGCSCGHYVDNDVMLKADCSNRWIGYNDTLLLPPKLNVSRLVKILDFTKNQLTSIDMDTFGDCEAVQDLQLKDNRIHSFLGVSCSRLLRLDLSRNNLKNLTSASLAMLPHLIEIDLSFNELLFLEPNTFEQLKYIRVLNLASNQLGMEVFYAEDYMLSLNNLKSLEELDLSNSSLPDFPQYLINGTTHLKRLILKDNLIMSIASGVFDQMEELVELDISGCLFEEILPNQFFGLKKLHVLTMDKMRKLKRINEYAFSGLAHLHELSCQTNYYLTYIDSLAFRADPSIANSTDSNPKIVRLGDNDLRYIDYPLLQWKTLDILELQRNSWVCDCNLQWVSDFYQHRPQEAAILADAYFSCYEPHIFAGVPVVHVNPEEMLCFSPAATVAGTIGIIIFGILLFSFCTVIILNQMGMLPDWVRQYNIFGSGSNLPTYTRVNPRPNTKTRRMVDRVQAIPELHCYSINSNGASGGNGPHNNNNKRKLEDETVGQEPPTDDLEWDNADIGRTISSRT